MTNILEDVLMSYVAPPPGTAVEIQQAQPPGDHVMAERGVIIHSAMTWLVAYFPGDPERPADPGDPASIRVLRTADIAGYRDLTDCDPTWVIGTWNHLDQVGPGLLQAPQATRVWELAARLAQHQVNANVASRLTHAQLERWAGRPLTPDDIDRLDDAIPHSSIPDAVAAIVDGMNRADAE